MKKFSLFAVVVLLISAFVVACAAPEPETIIQEVEKVVTQVVEVEVEKIITEVVEVMVEGETQEVEVTRVVEVENVVEVIVDPTDCNLEAPEDDAEINMLGWSFPIMDHYAEELEKCSRYDTLTVNTQLLASTDAKEQANLVLSSGGDSLDIVHGANGEIAAWGGPGWVMPLNDLVEKYWDEYNLGDIPQTAWDGATFDGNIYGVPVVGNTLHLIYNSEALDAAGVDVPDTYDEVIAMCDAIGLDNPDYDAPFTINLSAPWAWEIEFFQMQAAFGGQYLNDDNTPAFNDETGIQAIEMMVAIQDACMGDYGLTTDLNGQEVAIQLGTLPATNMWASRAANMTDPERTDLGDIIQYAPAPRAMDGGLRAGSAWNDFYMIPAGSTVDPDLTFRVIMEAADARSQRDAAEVGMATRASAAEFGGPYQPAAVQTIDEGIGIYQNNPAVAIARSSLEQFLPLVGSGEMTAQEALDAAAEAYMEEAAAQDYIDG